MAFGKYIGGERERDGRGMMLTELAQRVEISMAYLSRIEREREVTVTSPRGRARQARVCPAFACSGVSDASLRGSSDTFPASRRQMQVPQLPLAQA